MATYYYSSLFKKSDVRITVPFSTSHGALDMSRGVVNSPIYSPNKLGAGTVSTVYHSYSRAGKEYPNTLVVWIKYDNGVSMALYHGEVRHQKVKAGDRVQVGQQIYVTGNTGYSFGDHLHCELWKGGVKINPISWVINDNIPVATFKIGDKIVFTDIQNIRIGAGDKFKESGKSRVGDKATIKDGSRSSQNKQFGLGENDTYTWWDLQWTNGGTGWVADVGKFKIDSSPITPEPIPPIPDPVQPPVVPPEESECQKQVETLKGELKGTSEALVTAQDDVLRLSDELVLVKTERTEYKNSLDVVSVERNTWKNKYNVVAKELEELKTGRDTWIDRMADVLHKLFGNTK